MTKIEQHRREVRPNFAIICEDDDVELVEADIVGRKLYHLKPKKTELDAGVERWSADLAGVEYWDAELASPEPKSLSSTKSPNFNKFLSTYTEYKPENMSSLNKDRRLTVDAKEIGLVMTSFFASMLALSAIFRDALISPIIGWSGIVFGLGFFAMAKMKYRLP